jgi:hypothetical protein
MGAHVEACGQPDRLEHARADYILRRISYRQEARTSWKLQVMCMLYYVPAAGLRC